MTLVLEKILVLPLSVIDIDCEESWQLETFRRTPIFLSTKN